MKRLLQKFYKNTRLLRKKHAKWNPINMQTGNPIQILTDAMTYNATVQINYKNSGWRTILPYGWYSSKAGNVLLMCYKDTGEIRSYRMDRINDLLIDDNLIQSMPGDRPDEPTTRMNFNDFQIPMLPNIDEIISETENEDVDDLPYDAGLKALTENEVTDDYHPVDTINDNEEEQLSEAELEEETDENEDENDSFNDDLFNDESLEDFNFDDEVESDSDNNENEEEDSLNEDSLNEDSLKDFDKDAFNKEEEEDK